VRGRERRRREIVSARGSDYVCYTGGKRVVFAVGWVNGWGVCVLEIYMTMHFLFFPVRRRRAARVACSKTSRTPSFILAEHSRYRVAPILRATASPCTHKVRNCKTHVGCVTSSGLTGRCWVLRSSSIVFGSYRKSFLHPTKMIGNP